MSLSRTLGFILLATGLLRAAEGAGAVVPPPNVEPSRPPVASVPGQARMPQPMARPAPAYEVESLSIAPGDAAGLALWTELAAQGFHVVAASGEGGKQVLLLERLSPPGGRDLRLPGAVEANPDLAAATRARLQAIAAERQQAMRQPVPPLTAPVQGK